MATGRYVQVKIQQRTKAKCLQGQKKKKIVPCIYSFFTTTHRMSCEVISLDISTTRRSTMTPKTTVIFYHTSLTFCILQCAFIHWYVRLFSVYLRFILFAQELECVWSHIISPALRENCRKLYTTGNNHTRHKVKWVGAEFFMLFTDIKTKD